MERKGEEKEKEKRRRGRGSFFFPQRIYEGQIHEVHQSMETSMAHTSVHSIDAQKWNSGLLWNSSWLAGLCFDLGTTKIHTYITVAMLSYSLSLKKPNVFRLTAFSYRSCHPLYKWGKKDSFKDVE